MIRAFRLSGKRVKRTNARNLFFRAFVVYGLLNDKIEEAEIKNWRTHSYKEKKAW